MAKPMRRPNGYGTIVKRSGRRRNPYEIRVTAGFDTYIDEKDGKVKTRQIQKTLDTFPDYNSAALALALYNDNPYDPVLKNITFEQAYHEAMKQKADLVEASRKTYKIAFDKSTKLHKKAVVKIKLNDMQQLIDKEATQATQQQLITLYNAIFSWAQEKGILKTTPIKKLQITASKIEKREGMPYTPAEIKLLWRNLHILKGTDIMLIQIYAGLRITELLTLEKSNVHLQEGWMHITGTKTDNAERNVPIRKEISPLLRARIEDAHNTSDFVFCDKTGVKQLPRTTYLRNMFRPIKENLGLKDHIPHDARHTFITRADDSNINQTALKVIVGHALQGVTGKNYTHKSMDNLIAEMHKIKFF